MLSLGLKQAPYSLQIMICTQHSGEEAKIKTIIIIKKTSFQWCHCQGSLHVSLTDRFACRYTKKLMTHRMGWKNVYTTSITINTDLAEFSPRGAGIAQWLERQTRDWKVTGSNPCWNGGRIFFSRVDFLCWLLFRYPFHPRVTTVARKKSWSFCQKCRWQVTAKHAYTLRMWLLLNRASALVTTCP